MAVVCVVGAWHQASVVGPCLADLGHYVRGTDRDSSALARLDAGEPPVSEPGLTDLLQRHLASGRLRYLSSFEEALEGAEVAIVALDTPVGDDDSPILAPVFDAVRAVASALANNALLIVSSQVPVGTCDQIAALIDRIKPRYRCGVAYVPEFLRLGSAIELFLRPDRLLIGADDPAVGDRVAALYGGVDAPVLRMSIRSAEMAKHASNAFLATSVSFINEVAGLCEEVDCDALAVAEAMRLDRRIGPDAFLSPGLGFAGGTLGRDVRALQSIGRARQRPTRILDSVLQVNGDQTRIVIDRLRRLFDPLTGVPICLLGLTYKPGTSALRRSVSLDTAEQILVHGGIVRAHDPMVPPARAPEVAGGVQLFLDPYEAATGARAVVLMTEWPEYSALDWSRLAGVVAEPLVIDARNALDPRVVELAGFRYWGVGRATGPPSRGPTQEVP